MADSLLAWTAYCHALRDGMSGKIRAPQPQFYPSNCYSSTIPFSILGIPREGNVFDAFPVTVLGTLAFIFIFIINA